MESAFLYKQISEDFIRQIRDGKLPPGDKLPSVNEIKAKYGVSQKTALSVFRRLAELGLVKKSEGVGFHVIGKNTAPTQGSQRANRIGCLLRPLVEHNERDSFYNRLNQGMQKELLAAGNSILAPPSIAALNNLSPSAKSLEAIRSDMVELAGEVDGFVVDDRIPDNILAAALEGLRKPAVLVNRRTALALDSVMPDAADGAAKAVDAAIRMGYQRFVAVSGKRFFDREDKALHYLECLRRNGVANDRVVGVECKDEYFNDTVRGLLEIVRSGGGRTAFFCPDDYMAAELCDISRKAGFIAGKDLGVVGFGGIELARNHHPEITTIDSQPERLGALSAQILLARIGAAGDYPRAMPLEHLSETLFAFGKTL